MIKFKNLRTPGWLSCGDLPSARGVIPGSGIKFHIVLLAGSLLLLLPVSLPLSLSLSCINKENLFKKLKISN